MPGEMFAAVVAAVFFGNFLTLFCIYAYWRIDQEEKAGRPIKNLPGWVFVVGAAPPLFCAAIIYFIVQ